MKAGEAAVTVELLLTPDCPNAVTARTVLTECLATLGLDITVAERVGDYPSPTVLVDGVDVMTGAAGAPPMTACRLDVPTTSQVLAALRSRHAQPRSEGAV
jgi:hypothetical protein